MKVTADMMNAFNFPECGYVEEKGKRYRPNMVAAIVDLPPTSIIWNASRRELIFSWLRAATAPGLYLVVTEVRELRGRNPGQATALPAIPGIRLVEEEELQKFALTRAGSLVPDLYRWSADYKEWRAGSTGDSDNYTYATTRPAGWWKDDTCYSCNPGQRISVLESRVDRLEKMHKHAVRQ